MDEHFVRQHADAVLTVPHAKIRLQIHLVLYPVFFDEALHLFDDVIRTAQMAGTSDTHFDDHNNNLSMNFIRMRLSTAKMRASRGEDIFYARNRYIFIDFLDLYYNINRPPRQ